MLTIPTKGIRRSINVDNVSLDTLCDWIEATILFDEEELSKSDFIGVLLSEGIYENQDMASIRLDDAWFELERRSKLLGKSFPFKLGNKRITRIRKWQLVSPHSFCLLTSYHKWDHNFADACDRNYILQGELFENLTKESLEHLFADWSVLLTGWSRTTPRGLPQIVRDLASRLGEPVGKIGRWARPRQKDAGLDLVAYRSFDDGRVGFPVFLIQCASGKNWEEKLHTPNIAIWGRLIQFAIDPYKAFAVPYAIPSNEFDMHCCKVKGPILDRYRILSPGQNAVSWVSQDLKKRLVAWIKQQEKNLPRM